MADETHKCRNCALAWTEDSDSPEPWHASCPRCGTRDEEAPALLPEDAGDAS